MKTNHLHPNWQTLPRESIRAIQAKQLRQYLRDVVLPFHPYYKETFARLGLDWRCDLSDIPLTTKLDLCGGSERTKAFVITPDKQVLSRRPSTIARALLRGRNRVQQGFESEFRPILMTSTTGRSNEPVPFVFSGHDLNNLKVAGVRMMEMAGGRREDRMLNMFPFAPHLAFWQAHYAGTEFGVFMLSSGGGKTQGTEGNIRMLRKINPDVLIGMPTFVYHVLHDAVMDGAVCDHLRVIVLGGEKVPQGLRAKLRELASQLGAKNTSVISTYGFTEAKMAWCECLFPQDREAPGFHTYPDFGIVEVIDPETGKPQGDNQPGEIVYTPLDARGSCVLRYRTGDLIDGGLTYEPCPSCGRRLPRLVGRISRKSDIREMHIDKIKGTLVDFNELEHVLDDMHGLGAWQIEIRKRHDDPLDVDEMVLHVSLSNGGDESQLEHELSARVLERVEIRPNRIIFHKPSEIRRLQGVGEMLKEQRVIDKRPGMSPSTTTTTTTTGARQETST